MRWCTRCVLPDTRPNLAIGEDGVCNACRAHERRPETDWAARAESWLRASFPRHQGSVAKRP